MAALAGGSKFSVLLTQAAAFSHGILRCCGQIDTATSSLKSHARSLRHARDSQLVLHLVLQVQDPAVLHARVLDALRRFKAESFTDEFFAAFQVAPRQQLDRLRRQKRRLGRRPR
ncbi:hypothetical protein ZWY2020_027157 [Hordeum vulgare]|nr:hypothetical protein ZWY2020_027157 [Hordeum vulgare]